MDLEDLRVAVYRTFADSGRPPRIAGLAERLGAGEDAVVDGLRELARARHLVLDADDRIVMAHPFAAVPLGFSVMGAATLWWGGCAWDSFALPHLLPEPGPVLVATRCPACGRAHAWNVGVDAPPAGDQVAHFLVPVAHMWDDVVHTCGHQSVFCSTDCVEDWLERSGHEPGYAMDLETLWRLARGWYAGRLDHGYTRRDPAGAADYFREVGLTGPFWNL
jgi:alkylmercury lyase-like protein